MQVLIVDDDPFYLKLLDRALVSLGHTVMAVRSGEEALKMLQQNPIRLVITDWEMDGMDGLELCQAIRQGQLARYVYIIMLTGHDEEKTWQKGMNAGADALLCKPLDIEKLEVCLKTAERILSLEINKLGAHSVEQEPSQSTAQICGSSRAGQHGILVVEDSRMTRQALVSLLSQTGLPVQAACSAEEAMSIIACGMPALIVSDMEMPGANGIDLCRKLRTLAKQDVTHFIMVTGASNDQQMLEAYNAGVNDFVLKPYKPEELLAKVRTGLRAIELHEKLAEKASQLQAANSSLVQLNGRLGQLSITDDLTGLFNRRHAMVRLQEQWILSERYGRFLTVAVMDIDFFKSINDSFGHDAGDAVLRQIATILKDQTRTTDAVCRIGGEEFLIIFPSETIDEAQVCCERCRTAMESQVFNLGAKQLHATISIGVATRSGDTASFSELLQEADKALYAAKKAGRNRVCVAALKTEDSNLVSNAGAGNDEPINWAMVVGRSGGNTRFASTIAARFSEQAPLELARLRQALACGDAHTLDRTIHTLKSLTAYLSADASTELCRQIEGLCQDGKLAEIASIVPLLEASVTRVICWIKSSRLVDLVKAA